MLRSSESETEILLGNKQLLGIFFVVAVLLGVAFAGGYMVGKGPGKKGANVVSASDESAGATTAPVTEGGETHSVGVDGATDSPKGAVQSPPDGATASEPQPAPRKIAKAAPPVTPDAEEPPLGSPNRKTFQQQHEAVTQPEVPAPVANTGAFNTETGQTFLQVAAVGRDEAEAVADVLHKKGFRAHAVPKPGNPKLYRVLIGPIKDAGDLSTTRDSLRKTGFREVIVQHY